MIKNVLIVDDDQEMLVALENGFQKYEDTFSVITAENGEEAVKKLKKSTISLIVTDLKMPRMDGFSLLQHVMENFPDIPVIVITGYSTPEMEKMAREGGAVSYIAKPFMLDNLARKIMETLRKESEGGTLHSVSSGIFLQLMEMEQKTCTIRLEDKSSGNKGVLFFNDGELLDARANDLQGKPAAYEIFSWDKVTISIQNVCPPIANRINSDLQPLILEASRLKDESGEAAAPREPEAEETEEPAATPGSKPPKADQDPIRRIRSLIEGQVGQRSGLEDVYRDKALDGTVHQWSKIGSIFQTGQLLLGYVDRGEATDTIVLPGSETIVLSVNPKCPRDKITKVLRKR
jgi:DNA-binding response OmpR family regulator